MKFLLMAFIAATMLAYPSVSHAGPGHDHGEVHEKEHAGGPKGGRLLEGTEPHAEFLVEKDRSVTIAFYDDAMKPLPASEQKVILIADVEGNKTRLEFEKKGDVLSSQGILPDVENLNLIVQFMQDAESKPVNFRFAYDGNVCGECKRAEYACICEH